MSAGWLNSRQKFFMNSLSLFRDAAVALQMPARNVICVFPSISFTTPYHLKEKEDFYAGHI